MKCKFSIIYYIIKDNNFVHLSINIQLYKSCLVLTCLSSTFNLTILNNKLSLSTYQFNNFIWFLHHLLVFLAINWTSRSSIQGRHSEDLFTGESLEDLHNAKFYKEIFLSSLVINLNGLDPIFDIPFYTLVKLARMSKLNTPSMSS